MEEVRREIPDHPLTDCGWVVGVYRTHTSPPHLVFPSTSLSSHILLAIAGFSDFLNASYALESLTVGPSPVPPPMSHSYSVPPPHPRYLAALSSPPSPKRLTMPISGLLKGCDEADERCGAVQWQVAELPYHDCSVIRCMRKYRRTSCHERGR